MEKTWYGWVAVILVVIGSLNWVLYGLFGGMNLVAYLPSWLATIVYLLIGVSSLFLIYMLTQK